MDEVYVEDSSKFQKYEWAYNGEFDVTVVRVDVVVDSIRSVPPEPIRCVTDIAIVKGELTKQVRDAIADAYHAGLARGIVSVKGTTQEQVRQALANLG